MNASGTPAPQEEIIPKELSGMSVLVLNLVLMLGALAAVILGTRAVVEAGATSLATAVIVAGCVY